MGLGLHKKQDLRSAYVYHHYHQDIKLLCNNEIQKKKITNSGPSRYSMKV